MKTITTQINIEDLTDIKDCALVFNNLEAGEKNKGALIIYSKFGEILESIYFKTLAEVDEFFEKTIDTISHKPIEGFLLDISKQDEFMIVDNIANCSILVWLENFNNVFREPEFMTMLNTKHDKNATNLFKGF